jgi:uncharacterized protein YecT (DUF1311 family)
MKPWLALAIGTLLLANGWAGPLEEAKASFAKADKQLNATWQALKASLDDGTMQELLLDQRRWLEYKDWHARATAVLSLGATEGKEEASPDYWELLQDLTESRTAILRAWLTYPDHEATWTGVWADGQGGVLEIVRAGERLHFRLNVVRGPSFHLGSLEGVGEINGDLARFTTRDPSEEAKETWLHFHLNYPRLEVLAANTGAYHGVRAYFQGKYVRTGPLSEASRREVLAGEAVDQE